MASERWEFDAEATLDDLLSGETNLGALMSEADTHHRFLLARDPEWTAPRWVHRHVLLEMFVAGVVSADPWYHGYTLPPRFEAVVNHVARRVQELAPGDGEVIQLSLLDWEKHLREWLGEDEDFLVMCNQHDEPEGPGRVVFVSPGSATPTARDFIDMDALFRNAAVALRDRQRKDDAFDAHFRAEHEAEHPEWFTDDDAPTDEPEGGRDA